LLNCNNMVATMSRPQFLGKFSSLALALAIMLLRGSSMAQGAPPASTPQQAPRTHRSPTIEDRVRVLAKSLELSEAQHAAVIKILEDRQQQTLRIRQNTTISGSARIAQFRALQDNTVMRIRAVLNEEQKKKYDPLAMRRVAPAPDQKSVEDWLKVTNPQ
jgi:hypothetical protein